MKAVLKRKVYSAKQVTGTLTIYNEENKPVFTCHTLELADKENKQRVSCIPKGKYTVKPRKSPKYNDHFHVQDVPGRSYILIHHANFHSDLLGCIAVGSGLTDINGDGYKDVTSSKETMKKLVKLLPNDFELTIE